MKNTIVMLICAMFGVSFTATAQDAPLNGFTDVFACKLKDGRTMDNVWTTMEKLAALDVQSKAPPDPGFGIFVWTPFRTASGYDFIWGVNSSNLNAMAQGLSDYLATPGSEAIGANLDSTAKCDSGIVSFRRISTGAIGGKADRVPDAIVEVFSCKLKDGMSMEKMDKAVEFWQTEMKAVQSPALKSYAAWLWTPYRGGGTADQDFLWVGAYPDLKTWAQGDTDYYASKEGMAADARINEVSRCSSDLWVGYWIAAPAQAQ